MVTEYNCNIKKRHLKVNKIWSCNRGELKINQSEEDPGQFIIYVESKWAVNTLTTPRPNDDFLLYCLFRNFLCFHSHSMGIISHSPTNLLKSGRKSWLPLQPPTHAGVVNLVPRSILRRDWGGGVSVPCGAQQPLEPHKVVCIANTLASPGTPTPGCGTALAWQGERAWIT